MARLNAQATLGPSPGGEASSSINMTKQDPAIALVTGAALRLGRAIALDLAKRGWRIGVHYHSSSAAAQALVAEIEALGSTAVALRADLTREDQLHRLVESCAEELGYPTLLINNEIGRASCRERV